MSQEVSDSTGKALAISGSNYCSKDKDAEIQLEKKTFI